MRGGEKELMSMLINLEGTSFGVWKILKRANDRFWANGGVKVYWCVQCSCGSIFDMSAKNIMRRRNFPTKCEGCK